MRQTQYEGGGGFAFEKVEGQQQILWVERMPRAAVILESYVQGRPGQQRFVEQLGKQRTFKEHQRACCGFTRESDLKM